METGRVSKKTIDNVQFKWHDLYLLLQLLKVLNSNQVNSIAFLAVNKAGKKKKKCRIYFVDIFYMFQSTITFVIKQKSADNYHVKYFLYYETISTKIFSFP